MRKGVTSFQLLRHRRNEPRAFLYAFDLRVGRAGRRSCRAAAAEYYGSAPVWW